jgi:hypothetical protein
MLQTTTPHPHTRAEAIMHRIHPQYDEMDPLDMKKMVHILPRVFAHLIPAMVR